MQIEVFTSLFERYPELLEDPEFDYLTESIHGNLRGLGPPQCHVETPRNSRP